MRRFSEENINYFMLRHLSNIQDNTLFRDGFGELLADQNSAQEKKALLDRLGIFVKKYYVPNLMTATVYGRLSKDEGESLIVAKFNDLGTHVTERPLAISDYVPFVGRTYQRVFTVKGSRDGDVLYMNFVMPSVQQYYKQLPLEYVSSQVNYYSYNSLKYSLLRQDLVTDLSDTVSA